MATKPWVRFPASKAQLDLIKHYNSLHPKKVESAMKFYNCEKYSQLDWNAAHGVINIVEKWRIDNAEELEKGEFDFNE